MALNWNISKVANKDTVCFTEHENGCYEIEKRLSSLTERLIWATMRIGVGRITAKNIDEWLFRLDVVARVYEDRDGYGSITRDDLTKHIGLSTNASETTRAGFLRMMTDALVRQASDAVRYSTTEATSA